MIISVVSGKGGAGKTTIATSLAHILKADYYDLDVDAPNGEYFLQPQDWQSRQVSQHQPVINQATCTACGLCTRECRFHALYKILDKIYLTETLCHSCNLCREVCPAGAISYQQMPIGEVRTGFSRRSMARAIIGDLAIGSTRGTALIQDIVRHMDASKRHVVIDGPPGNSCAAVAAIKPAELIVLVVEPTPFGLHDMLQTMAIVESLQKPVIVIANKSQDDAPLQAVLDQRGYDLAASIPLHGDYHRLLLGGEILSRASEHVHAQLVKAIAVKVML
jgi:MinD superfamily P-loop ATPase